MKLKQPITTNDLRDKLRAILVVGYGAREFCSNFNDFEKFEWLDRIELLHRETLRNTFNGALTNYIDSDESTKQFIERRIDNKFVNQINACESNLLLSGIEGNFDTIYELVDQHYDVSIHIINPPVSHIGNSDEDVLAWFEFQNYIRNIQEKYPCSFVEGRYTGRLGTMLYDVARDTRHSDKYICVDADVLLMNRDGWDFTSMLLDKYDADLVIVCSQNWKDYKVELDKILRYNGRLLQHDKGDYALHLRDDFYAMQTYGIRVGKIRHLDVDTFTYER